MSQPDDALTLALQAVGDKWTLHLIRQMIAGSAQTYQTLLVAVPGIPTNILASRLKRLVEAGLIEKRPYQTRPERFEYALTSAGMGLAPVVEALEDWSVETLNGTRNGVPLAPPNEPKVSPKQNEWSFGPDDNLW